MFGEKGIVHITPLSRETPNRIIMCTCNMANYQLYTKTPTLMLMVLYMIMPQRRCSELDFIGHRVTPDYTVFPN